MTTHQISTDIERGITLRESVKVAQAELKQIEKRLEQAGLSGTQIPLQESDREGRQFLAKCESLNLVIPVIFESDQIMASVQPGTEVFRDLKDSAKGFFSKFWQPISKYDRLQKDGQAYRKAARETLGSDAPLFISKSLQRDKSGIPKSRTIIAWENSKSLDLV